VKNTINNFLTLKLLALFFYFKS